MDRDENYVKARRKKGGRRRGRFNEEQSINFLYTPSLGQTPTKIFFGLFKIMYFRKMFFGK